MTQQNRILSYLKEGNSLTPLDALSIFGCFRLASRISDLRKEGHNIEVDIIKQNGKRFAKYYIPKNIQLEIGSAI